MDFSSLDPVQKPAIFPIEFRTEYEPIPDKPGEMRPVDVVKWAKKGTSNGATTEDKVERLKKGSVEWPVLEPHYEAWKKKQEAPIDGTPLAAWPGLTKQQAKVLSDFNLRSVEDFAAAPDSVIVKMQIPGIRQLQGRAKAFIEAAKGQSLVAAELAKRDETIEALKNQLGDAMAAIEELRKDKEDEPKRGPGRPRKDA
jgi:hypothetical protein